MLSKSYFEKDLDFENTLDAQQALIYIYFKNFQGSRGSTYSGILIFQFSFHLQVPLVVTAHPPFSNAERLWFE